MPGAWRLGSGAVPGALRDLLLPASAADLTLGRDWARGAVESCVCVCAPVASWGRAGRWRSLPQAGHSTVCVVGQAHPGLLVVILLEFVHQLWIRAAGPCNRGIPGSTPRPRVRHSALGR